MSRKLWQIVGIALSACIYLPVQSMAQGCCSGGACSPIAGGTSQGVLADRQAEFSSNFQYINTRKFLSGTKDTSTFLDDFHSEYLYTRLAYGLSAKLTLSLEAGYFLNKTQIGLLHTDVQKCSGVGDFIIFPRYEVFQRTTTKTRSEIAVGLGLKLPVGKYLDSFVTFTDPRLGKKYFTAMAPAVMPSTGSQDVICYLFGYRGYPEKNLRLFTSILYMHKGWNPLGEKFGDYASIGMFAGKTFFRKLGVTLQLKGEWVDGMKTAPNIDPMVYYNLDPNSTGGKKVLLVPQLNYIWKIWSFYALTEIPMYQYVNGTAIAAQYQLTCGFSYRFTIPVKDVKEQ